MGRKTPEIVCEGQAYIVKTGETIPFKDMTPEQLDFVAICIHRQLMQWYADKEGVEIKFREELPQVF